MDNKEMVKNCRQNEQHVLVQLIDFSFLGLPEGRPLGFIYIIALVTHLIADSLGLVVIILAIASIGKVIERSVNRALFIPSQNILFQAFDANSKSIVQSYTSGYGVPLGQLFAGILMLLFLLIDSYEMKITLLFVFLILITIIWFLNTVKLKKGYQKQLLDLSLIHI